jgi:hypothetical protein
VFSGSLARQHKNTGTDDRTDAEHRKIKRGQRLFQMARTGLFCLGDYLVDWFSREK